MAVDNEREGDTVMDEGTLLEVIEFVDRDSRIDGAGEGV